MSFESGSLGILKDENLIKNIFFGLGLFVFVEPFLDFYVHPALNSKEKVFLSSSILFLTFIFFLSVVFWAVYVLRPIMKIIWSDFGVPGIDSGVKGSLERLTSNGVFFFIMILLISIAFCLAIYQLLL